MEPNCFFSVTLVNHSTMIQRRVAFKTGDRPRETVPLVFAAHLIPFTHPRYHPQECITSWKGKLLCSGSVIGRLPAKAQRANQWTGQRLLLQIHHLWYLPSNLVARNWISPPPPLVPFYYDGLFPFKGGSGRQLSGYRLQGIITTYVPLALRGTPENGEFINIVFIFTVTIKLRSTRNHRHPQPPASLLTICQNNFGHECVCASE